MKLILLRVFLLTAAFGWAISAFGIFMPWPWVITQLQGLGAGNIPSDPMLDYWLRMTAGAFTAIGLFFLLLAINPKRFREFIPLAGIFLFAEGIILLIHGLRLHLGPLPFYVDTVFCLAIGAGIWLLRNGAKTTPNK
jgi:hypothetical protein